MTTAILLPADDERHGKRSGYLAGCKCFACRQANRDYCKRYRTRKILSGGEVTTPVETVLPHLRKLRETMSAGAIAAAVGTTTSHVSRLLNGETKRVTHRMAAQILAADPSANVGSKWVDAGNARRRIQSLVALGHSLPEIDRNLGYGRQNLWSVANGRSRITSDWDCRIRKVWEDMSMRIPEPLTQYHRSAVTKTLNIARANNWAPPLAYDDIEDPTENPTGWEYVPATRAEHLADLDHRQAGITEVCAELGIRRDSVERWCERHGLRAMYVRFMERETPIVERRNQWSA